MTNRNGKVVWFFKNFIKFFKNRGIIRISGHMFCWMGAKECLSSVFLIPEDGNSGIIRKYWMGNWKIEKIIFCEILIFDKDIKKYQSSKIASSYRLTLSATFLASLTSYVNFFLPYDSHQQLEKIMEFETLVPPQNFTLTPASH